jgi:M6 family metalloprotease-like protein
MLNQQGYSDNGGTGSARDYFIESSFGAFSPQFDVVGPFDLPQNMAFYGENNSQGRRSKTHDK